MLSKERVEALKPLGRSAWWAITVALLGYYVFCRWSELQTGRPDPLDLLLFVVLVAIWILPFVTEVKIWGFQIKREVQKLRSEVATLQHTVVAQATANQTANQHVHFTFDPASLRAWNEREAAKALDHGVSPGGAQLVEVPPAPPQSLMAFNTRFEIERKLGNLVRVGMRRNNHGGVILGDVGARMRYLQMAGVIDSNLSAAITQVLAAANQLIHGVTLGDAEYDVFKTGAEFVLRELRAIPDE